MKVNNSDPDIRNKKPDDDWPPQIVKCGKKTKQNQISYNSPQKSALADKRPSLWPIRPCAPVGEISEFKINNSTLQILFNSLSPLCSLCLCVRLFLS